MIKFCLYLYLLMLPLHTYADICPNNFDLDTEVTTKRADDVLVVLITLTNNSKKTMKIPIKSPNIFLTNNGRDMPFIGYYYYDKHIPKLSDYEDLQANHSTKREIDITKDYLFEKGKIYKLFVPGGYYDPIKDLYYCGKDGVAYFEY
jgi:hypothetical protein